MADPQFFNNTGPYDLSTIKDHCEISVPSEIDLSQNFEDIAPLDKANAPHISFLENKKYKDQASQTKAGACFVTQEDAHLLPEHCIALITKYPYKSLALCAHLFFPEDKQPEPFGEGASDIHDSAVIHPSAVIGANVTIGTHTRVEANATIAQGCQIGAHCIIEANASVSHAIIGDHVIIYAGARIGRRGFGYTIDPKNGHMRVPQLGRVILENHVEIGANTCVDRGMGPDTIIKEGAKLDNLIQIAHNVEIGAHSFLAGQVGISGSTKIGTGAMLAGQVGITGHLSIGDNAFLSAQSGVFQDVENGAKVMGAPAVPVREFMKREAWLRKTIRGKKRT